jgi:hypothetical protein
VVKYWKRTGERATATPLPSCLSLFGSAVRSREQKGAAEVVPLYQQHLGSHGRAGARCRSGSARNRVQQLGALRGGVRERLPTRHILHTLLRPQAPLLVLLRGSSE